MKENREGQGRGAMELLGRYLATVYLNSSTKAVEKAVYRLPTILPKVANGYNRKAELTVAQHDDYVTFGDVDVPVEDEGLGEDPNDDNLGIVAEDDVAGGVVRAQPAKEKKKKKAAAKKTGAKKLAAKKAGNPANNTKLDKKKKTTPASRRSAKLIEDEEEEEEAREGSPDEFLAEMEKAAMARFKAVEDDSFGDMSIDDGASSAAGDNGSEASDASLWKEPRGSSQRKRKRDQEAASTDTDDNGGYAMDAFADSAFCEEYGIPTFGGGPLLPAKEIVKLIYSAHRNKLRKLSSSPADDGGSDLGYHISSPSSPLPRSAPALPTARDPFGFADPSPRSLLRDLISPVPSSLVATTSTAQASSQVLGPFAFGLSFGAKANSSGRMASALRAPTPPPSKR